MWEAMGSLVKVSMTVMHVIVWRVVEAETAIIFKMYQVEHLKSYGLREGPWNLIGKQLQHSH